MPWPTLLTAGLVFIAVALATLSAVLLVEWARERLRARRVVKQLRQFAEEGLAGPAAEGLLRAPPARAPWLEPLLARVPTLRWLEELLRRGQTALSLQGFLFATLGAAVGIGLVALLVTGVPVVAAILGGLGASVPYLVVRRRANRRIRALEEQLPDAIDLMGRAIRAGHPLAAGFKMVAEEATPPVAEEFLQVFEEQRFGLAFEDSMYALAGRVPLVDVRILITAILIHRQVGGNLAEVLDNLAYTIRERFKLRRQLRVLTAQGRVSGYVLGLLPLVLGGVIFLISRDYILTLFIKPVGQVMLVLAAIFQISGYLWIRKIVDIEF